MSSPLPCAKTTTGAALAPATDGSGGRYQASTSPPGRARAHRSASGGAGRWRGGDGIVRVLRFLEPATVTLLTSHRIVPPHGMAGGAPGACGENWLRLRDGTPVRLGANDHADLEPGDAVELRSPGGGGFGIV